MTAISGKDGKVTDGTNTLAEISEWSLDVEADVMEVTKFGDQWRVKIVGLKDWSGSFAGRWDMTDTNGQLAFQNAILGGTTKTLRLYVNATQYYSGTAIIEGLSVESAVDSTVDTDWSFQGSGALTFT